MQAHLFLQAATLGVNLESNQMQTNGVTSFKHVATEDEKVLFACNNRRFVFAGRKGMVRADRSIQRQATSVRMAIDFASDARQASGDCPEGFEALLSRYFSEEFEQPSPDA